MTKRRVEKVINSTEQDPYDTCGSVTTFRLVISGFVNSLYTLFFHLCSALLHICLDICVLLLNQGWIQGYCMRRNG